MDHETPPEEIVANVLHVLSQTTTSPLLCRCTRDGSSSGGTPSWDPLVSFADPSLDNSTQDVALGDESGTKELMRHWTKNMKWKATSDEDMVEGLKPAFADTGRLDELEDGAGTPREDLLWRAGLEVLQDQISTAEGSNGNEPIPPHVLLRTIMDGYYCRDVDFGVGELIPVEEETRSESECQFYLPSSLAMFALRSFLMAHALESAAASIEPTLQSSKPVRWKRLRSMADDALALYRRMAYDYVGHAVDVANASIDNPQFDGRPDPLRPHPIEPQHAILIAAWSYAHLVFPACRTLLGALLRSHANGSMGRSRLPPKALETCYDCLGMLASLLALEVTTVDEQHTAPSRSYMLLSYAIENASTDRFFQRVKSVQEGPEGGGYGDVTQVDDEDDVGYRPWTDRGPDLAARGRTAEEDFLLCPTFRKRHEGSDQASRATYYDELGVAVIAYWKARAQADASLAMDALPGPYSGSYRWSLLFPQVVALLCGSGSSSTIEKMDDMGVISSDTDDLLKSINYTTISLGFDLLRTMIDQLHAIRPLGELPKRVHLVALWAHSAEGLQSTIVMLLRHVMRLSSLEMSRGDRPTSEISPALEYSSKEVLQMTETLLRFYDPAVQIDTLSNLCSNVEAKDKILLPKLLDFMRPLVMDASKSAKHSSDGTTLSKDVALMKEVTQSLDLFLNDIQETFKGSSAPLPNNIEEFMAFGEVYSSVFATLRWQRVWIARCQALDSDAMGDNESLQCFRRIINWMESCVEKLKTFESGLGRLIDLWQGADDKPDDWHRLFLVKLALQDALAEPVKEDN